MTNPEYDKHLERIKAAMDFEIIDRVPFVASGSAVNAAIMGVTVADYIGDMELCCTTNIEGIKKYAGDLADGAQATIFKPQLLSMAWLGRAKVPGVDLPDNELWQMDEKETVTQDDYDLILEMGFKPWLAQLLKERLGDPVSQAMDFIEYSPIADQRFKDAGIPNINGAACDPPMEKFCGGRTLMKFFMDDLFEIPEKLDQVFRLVQDENLADWEAQFKNPETRPVGVWIGGWRGTPDMLNPEMFERFSWQYFREIAQLCIDYGVIPIFHMDSNWDKGIECFKDIPRHSAIMALDGMTDIFKAREVIGDHLAIMGDVPSAMQSPFHTPDEVDAYCKRLIYEVGPAGYLMCSGCDSPFNATLENLEAMAHSVEKYLP